MVGSSVNSMLITYFVVLHFSRLNLTFPCRLYLLIEEGKDKKKKKKAGYQSLVGYHWRGLYVMILGWGKCATRRHLNCVSHKNSIYMVDSTTLCPSSSPKKKTLCPSKYKVRWTGCWFSSILPTWALCSLSEFWIYERPNQLCVVSSISVIFSYHKVSSYKNSLDWIIGKMNSNIWIFISMNLIN